jgi:hypothetical protein
MQPVLCSELGWPSFILFFTVGPANSAERQVLLSYCCSDAANGPTLFFRWLLATLQGDSELDGTGIETSVNGKFKLTLHKKASLPTFVQVRSLLTARVGRRLEPTQLMHRPPALRIRDVRK